MKAYLDKIISDLKILVLFIISLIIVILLTGCSKELKSNTIIINNDENSSYSKLVEKILPGYKVEEEENKAYYIVDAGGISESFDTQAVGAIETGIAKHWYPQYLATVIIAIDRDSSDTIVSTWSDLLNINEEVALFDSPGNIQMISAAISYGLEGKNYTMEKTIELLALLNNNNRLKTNSFDAPILICYDNQATNLIESGRNLEIIIPTEGTFTYEKGLLSNDELYFKGDPDKLLLEKKFRLLDGRLDDSIYPDKSSYINAVKVEDYKHFSKATRKVSCLFQRKVLNSKKIMSIDHREHLHFALIYIIISTIWIVSIIKRSMQKSITYAAFFSGIILTGWIFIRLVKYQIELNINLKRYLWYSFYIFQLTLPLVLLWMAWAIDKAEDETFPPKWWQRILILINILIVIVFTNDLHGFVLKLNLISPDWDINYGYGFAYYIILFVCMINLIVVFAILLKKAIRNPRKKGFIFPIIIFILFGIYNYKYIARDSFVYSTDITIVTGIFTMLMFEACIRSGLIPVNSKYIELFKSSPLKIQIINKEGNSVLSSISSVELEADIINKVLVSAPVSIIQNDGSALLANSIPGGYVVWHDDIIKLYNLQQEIYQSTKKLSEANAILMEEKKLKRIINEKNSNVELMLELELEISENIEKLKSMIEKLPNLEDQRKESTRIALLLCYIKRRSNIFFIEKERNAINLDDLIIYIDELIHIVKNSDVQIVSLNKIKGNISIRHARLFYDFFYRVLDKSLQITCPYIITHFEMNEEFFSMRFLPSEDIGKFDSNPKLILAILAENGKIVRKELEDTTGINISFPKGGL